METLKSNCLRCGECCFLRVNDKKKACRFLSFYGAVAFCRIYKNRIGVYCGTLEGIKFKCSETKQEGFKCLNLLRVK